MGDCLPMVLSEAGAVGLPLVSTDVGAISEIVRDGETGLLVPVDDVGALAAALHRLADDPDAAPPHGRGGASARAGAVRCRRQRPHPRRPVARRRRRPPAGGSATMSATTLVTVSGTIPDDLRAQIAAGRRPRTDYVEMAAAFDAELLDRSGAMGAAGVLGPLLGRLDAGLPLAWACFRRRKARRVVFTDGEQVGIPYAAMTLLVAPPPTPRHDRSRPLTAQEVAACTDCSASSTASTCSSCTPPSRPASPSTSSGTRRDQVVLSHFMVDTGFWRPDAVTPARRDARCCALSARNGVTTRRSSRPSATSTPTSPSRPPARGRSARTARPASTFLPM